MPLFTLEVSGRPVLVFSEDDRGAAERLAASSIGPDLLDFEEEGRPVWDGEDELSVRDAGPDEAARWEQGRAEAQQDADAAGDDQEADGFAVFLIEVADAGAEED
jgi:hypothetical protein